jgi:hypothetical protein
LAHVVGQLESLRAGHRRIGEPAGKQICESEAFKATGNKLMAPVLRLMSTARA